MSGKTKIFVFHMKELIYTGIFIVLAIVLIWLLIFMFGPGSDDRTGKSKMNTSAYTPGVYTSTIDFQGHTLDVSVTVDENHINGVSFVNLDEAVTTMYPLMESSMESISEQVCATQSLEDVTHSQDSQYTSQMLLNAAKDAIKKAEVAD